LEKTTTEAWVRRWLRVTRREAFDPQDAPSTVGELELSDHQSRAVDRGGSIAKRYGGVLIADAVGLGKTRVGLAIARMLLRDERKLDSDGRRRHAWVCAPARLREDWEEALSAGRLKGRIVSHTELSRDGRASLPGDPGVVIVDEAHRFRNPGARRSRALAELASKAPVVLMTATPVCNDVWDLYHLLNLFMAEDDLRSVIGYDLRDGFERAEEGRWDLAELLERVAIRRRNVAGWSDRPSVRLEKLTYEPDEAEKWVWRHLAPRLDELTLEAFGGDWPKGLFVEHVRKRWESSPAAALRTLKRVALFHCRWLRAAHHGHRLGRREYKRWFGQSVRQEAMRFVLDGTFSEEGGVDEVIGREDRAAVRGDLELVEELVARIEDVIGGGGGAPGAVGQMVKDAGSKTLVFCEFYRTAEAYFQTIVAMLGPTARVGMVTGRRARATGLGSVRAGEIRARFAPTATGSRFCRAHEQLQVLVATDCLAEGVNLQDCGRLVLADMPYSPLKVEQRVGRLVRPGSPHAEVTVYLPEPSVWAETLGLRRCVSRKVQQAKCVGSQPAVTASLASSDATDEATREMNGSVDGREAGGGPGGWEPVEPMEAMTRLDALYRALAERDGDESSAEASSGTEAISVDGGMTSTTWWREVGESSGDGDVAEAWIRWCIRDVRSEQAAGTSEKFGEDTLWGWAVVRADGWVVRRSHLVRPLTALAQMGREIRRCSANSGASWTTPIEEWLAGRVETLQSSRLAPAPISIDEPQWKLWARVKEAVAADELECDPEVYRRVRANLLRTVAQGERRRFGRWWEADPSADEIVSRMRGASAAGPRGESGNLEGRIVSVLLVEQPPEPPAAVRGA